jgi:signal transduction histidine kinase/ActR/RegA family two-component response regulator
MATQDAGDRLTPAAGRGGLGQAGRWLLLLGVLMGAILAGVAALQWQQSAMMSRILLSSGDNVAHFLYQADNEYLRLREAWMDAMEPGPKRRAVSADALQLRYDIFVSRIEVLRNAARNRTIGARPDVQEAMRRAEAFIARADEVLGPGRPPVDLERLRPLVDELLALDQPMRALTLGASELITATATESSETARRYNHFGIAMTVLLTVLAMAFALYALRALRRERERRGELEVLTAQLREARVWAEQASEAKSSFLANMSHEIRTPFMGLQGMLGLLGKTSLDEQQSRFLRVASGSAQHLLTLLNDILDLSRLESGRIALSPSAASLRDLAGEIEALMRPQAELKGLAFRLTVDPGVPALLRIDATRLRQVLFNLVANAIKFTDAGEVHLAVRPSGPPRIDPARREPLWPLEILISDTGVGIDDALMERLFQRFSQGDESRSRRFGGTGLGLQISRTLARLMGGDISAVSRPGQGSVFTFAVELEEASGGARPEAQEAPSSDQAEEPAQQAAHMTGLRLLVAEDNEVNRMVMEAILAGLGHTATFVENGRQALQQASFREWSLILMDLHMPEMDGLEATQAIRALPEPQRARVPIAALTADVFPETRERCLAAGIDEFLTKPVDTAELSALLARVSAGRFAPR